MIISFAVAMISSELYIEYMIEYIITKNTDNFAWTGIIALIAWIALYGLGLYL